MAVIEHDIRLVDIGLECLNLRVTDGDLEGEVGLDTAVLISLFTNRFVPTDDLDRGEPSNMGWWADELSVPSDDLIGSNWWTLERGKITQEQAARFEDGARVALQWMIDDGLATVIRVEATPIAAQNKITIDIEILRPDGTNIPFQFAWDGQEFKRISGVT